MASKRSENAFERLFDGKYKDGADLCARWSVWVRRHCTDDLTRWSTDAEFMRHYNAVIDAENVPAKRKAIRAFLAAYETDSRTKKGV